MKVRISPLIIPLTVVFVLMGSFGQLLVAYACITAHELAHYAAAVCIGLCGEELFFSPFGAHLTLKSRFIGTTAEEIILYSAGPLLNGILSLVGIWLKNQELYRVNTALMLMNFLPVTPLDGGMIVRRLLASRTGAYMAKKLMNIFSLILGIIFLAAAISAVVLGRINYSMFIMALFFFGNSVTGRELYNTDMIYGLTSRKDSDRVKLVMLRDKNSASDIIKLISPAYTIIAAETDKCGNIKLIHERELINIQKYLSKDLKNPE